MKEQIGRLDVAVDDARLVRLGKRLARLHDVVDGLVDRELLPHLDPLRQVAAFEVLHHHEGHAVLGKALARHGAHVHHAGPRDRS